MKLRIKGNSIRFRLTRSEVQQLQTAHRLEETLWLAGNATSRLTYAVEANAAVTASQIRHTSTEIVAVIPKNSVSQWATGEDVGIYATLDLGSNGKLELAIEKDFACLDRDDEENADAFPNPKAGKPC